MQVSRPWKMICMCKLCQCSFGRMALAWRSVLARFLPESARPSLLQILCMWVSTGKAGILNHWLWITWAVFAPTPERDVSSLKSEGTSLPLSAFAQPIKALVLEL